LRNVTSARWDAVDAEACEDERKMIADGEVVWSWRPGAGAKFRRISPTEVTVARKPVTGEHEVSRKTTAQGRPDCLR
jgi:hypothetical protein